MIKHLLDQIEDINYQDWPMAAISLKRIERLVKEHDLDDKTPMDQPNGALWPLISWCKTHVKGRWTYHFSDSHDEYQFFFRTPGEATRFKLTWG